MDADVEQSLIAIYDDGVAAWTPAEAVELVLTTVLLSPHFLYHVELSLPEAGEAVTLLDDYELASRLSYFVWASMPDEALLDAAEAGELATVDGPHRAGRAHARR